MVSLVVGKRTHEQTKALVHDAKRRLRRGHLPVLFTEAYEGDASAIFEAFGRRYRAPSQGVSVGLGVPSCAGPKAWPRGRGKNSIKDGGLSESKSASFMAKPECNTCWCCGAIQQINTSVIARHNGTSRIRNQRKVRKTLAFSKVSSPTVSPVDALARGRAVQFLSGA